MHPVPETDQPPLDRLRQIVHLLRAPGGCPWDMEQTHESLVPNLLEEAYESAEAILSGDRTHAEEELGDLLLQVVLHSEIANETGGFTLDSVAHGISEKLVRRHPHVFGDSDAKSTGEVLAQWDEIKKAEKGGAEPESVLDGISLGLPALMRSQKLQKKAAKVGFDWPDMNGALEKVREEVEEIAAAPPEELGEEIGDLLLATVSLARKAGFDAETLLVAANVKFTERFTAVEKAVDVHSATLEEMDAAWDAAKVEARNLPTN